MLQGLKDVRVVDYSTTIAGNYTAKLLADAGAEVVKVEPTGGEPMRHWTACGHAVDASAGSALFQFLNTSKQSVTPEAGEDQIHRLLLGADLVINTASPQDFNPTEFCDRHPDTVLLTITPYGHSGPYKNRAATEFILQAESGSLSGRGLPEREPFMAGGRITEWVGGTYAAVAALAAVRKMRTCAEGDHIDFSLLEVMNIAGTSYADLMASLAGRPAVKGPVRSIEIPSIEPTRDGWVGFTTNSFQQYSDFLVLLNRTDLLADKALASIQGRTARAKEWNDIVHQWTEQQTTEEIVTAAALLRIPVAPVNNGRTVLNHEHFQDRGVFVRNPGGGFLQPRPPYLIDGVSPEILQAAPLPGEHNRKFEFVAQRPTPTDAGKNELPLAGIRVLDATAWWAGPSATQMLAHLGAEVIHLEAIQRMDGMRMLGGRFIDKPRWWEYSSMYLGANSNKLGLTLDLDQQAGIETVRELIAHCDVFVENYSPRVMEKFGLDWPTIQSLNPRTIMVRMPAFGLSGPWKNHVGFAQTMEQITGMAWLTGFADDQPRIQRGPCDPLAGMNAAFATLVALAERETSGRGSFIECPMVEGALNAAAEQILEYSAYGNVLQRDGNRSPQAAPQGLYSCDGHSPQNEQWLALSIESDAQWENLVRGLGSPTELSRSDYSSHRGRRRHQEDIDTALHALINQRPLNELVKLLADCDVPVGEVRLGGNSSEHPQLAARDFYEVLDHPVVGMHPFVTPPFRSRHVASWLRNPAPTLGQDNHQLLRSVLAYSDEKIAELEALGVIGDTPLGMG